jgi:hypothetical protein
MKHTTTTTLAIVVTIATIFAFAKADEKSEGAIGDVKYSVLPPDKFREENGNGWVLMDDKVPVTGSALDTKHGIKEIPDVRGLFIRCLNGTRNDDKADKFKKENNRERLLGEYQQDQIISHNHSMNFNLGQQPGWSGGWGGAGQVRAVNSPGDPNWDHHPQPFGGTETRPENIALYTYIKINE